MNSDGGLYMRNDGASVTQGLAAAAYATLGETAGRPAHDVVPRALATRPSPVSTSWARAALPGKATPTALPPVQGIITAAHIAYTAAGEDLFASHPFFRQRLLYDAFAAYPDTLGRPGGAVVKLPRALVVEQASIAGDGRRAVSWHSRDTRRNGLVLSRRFAGTEEAGIWNWVFRQPAVDQASDDGESVYELLYYSPTPAASLSPSAALLLRPEHGFVYIRSDWDSPDATWIAFWAGPHIDTHQHLDQGSFTVFKRRDLAPKTGHYDSRTFSSPTTSRLVHPNGKFQRPADRRPLGNISRLHRRHGLRRKRRRFPRERLRPLARLHS